MKIVLGENFKSVKKDESVKIHKLAPLNLHKYHFAYFAHVFSESFTQNIKVFTFPFHFTPLYTIINISIIVINLAGVRCLH
jgi:hypothetical protein